VPCQVAAHGRLTTRAYTWVQVPGIGVALTDHHSEDPLAGRRVVAVVLRVVLDGQGVVLHGEVVDVGTRSAERFAGWEGLVVTVRRCLARPAAGGPAGGETAT
jgi:hypothetical protein